MSSLVMKKKHIRNLFVYFSILLLFGLALSVYVFQIASCDSEEITKRSIIGGLASSLVGSTVFYTRKLYKGMISKSITCSDENELAQLGTALYFFFRPIFAICFSTLVLIGMKLSISFVSITESTLNSNYVFLGMFLSFIVGFGSGDVLTILEMKSKGIINDAGGK